MWFLIIFSKSDQIAVSKLSHLYNCLSWFPWLMAHGKKISSTIHALPLYIFRNLPQKHFPSLSCIQLFMLLLKAIIIITMCSMVFLYIVRNLAPKCLPEYSYIQLFMLIPGHFVLDFMCVFVYFRHYLNEFAGSFIYTVFYADPHEILIYLGYVSTLLGIDQKHIFWIFYTYTFVDADV